MVGIALLEREVTSPGPLETDKVVVIPRNTGVSEIAELLRREGVIGRQEERRLRARSNDRDLIVGLQRVLEEPLRCPAHFHRLGCVVPNVVEDQHKETRRLDIVRDQSGRQRGPHRRRREVDELERLDRLVGAVLEQLEVGRLEIMNRTAVAARGDDVDSDQLDAGAEGRLPFDTDDRYSAHQHREREWPHTLHAI